MREKAREIVEVITKLDDSKSCIWRLQKTVQDDTLRKDFTLLTAKSVSFHIAKHSFPADCIKKENLHTHIPHYIDQG